jgi:hypothetical protein
MLDRISQVKSDQVDVECQKGRVRQAKRYAGVAAIATPPNQRPRKAPILRARQTGGASEIDRFLQGISGHSRKNA